MVLVIENYDSFTYNLVQYLGELGADVKVMRNDATSVEMIAQINPDRILISPGPGRPEHAGVTMSVIRELGETTPILGVCLGHQAIGAVFGGCVTRACAPLHGKTSMIEHDGRGVFTGLGGPLGAAGMVEVMEGRAAPAQIAGLLIGLAMKGERPTEIVGLARTMRAHAVQVSRRHDRVFDTCGTGGDGAGTFNISTCAALVLAACGVRGAQHGHRAASSPSGSPDVFEALGARVTAPQAFVERCIVTP